MDKLRRVSTADFSENWIDLISGDDKTEVIRISVNDELPFISTLFCERILKAVMTEIEEQINESHEGKSYTRPMTYFDRKRVERIANKIIEEIKSDSLRR